MPSEEYGRPQPIDGNVQPIDGDRPPECGPCDLGVRSMGRSPDEKRTKSNGRVQDDPGWCEQPVGWIKGRLIQAVEPGIDVGPCDKVSVEKTANVGQHHGHQGQHDLPK